MLQVLTSAQLATHDAGDSSSCNPGFLSVFKMKLRSKVMERVRLL